ncbi:MULTISPECIES: ABC transporter permease [Haloferax]|uniref:ABC transporter permease subunit n=1 Tax=Haloferax marinum TaxID=2666143 RepID=A0A6A8G9B7_9EURY|nr:MULTISPECIES: ABC transporter permease [Haloferax]KAB1197824.1 ABC transporter permease [Haloferax sp. CBA1150]MRW96883.1 ABC transporter permease subunit [Haloferax marinum]
MSMKRYVAVRTIQTAVLLMLILTFLFMLFRLIPGSIADQMIFQGASPEAVAAFEEQWGLNDPLHVQYYHYLVNMAQLDPGTSLHYRKPVLDYVKLKMFNTFILVAPGVTAGYLLGTSLGTIMGIKRDSLLEKYGIFPIVGVGTTPSFFLAIIGVIIFAGWLGLVPTSGMITPQVALEMGEDAPWWKIYTTGDFLWHYVLPFSVIAIKYMYEPLLIMRTSVVEMAGQDFLHYHKLTGLPKARWIRHLGKHAIIPIITFYPISLGRAISGLVLIEIVFNWPGIGNALVEAVLQSDYPVIQFVFFLTAAFVVVGNYVVDIVYGMIDPRISIAD